MNWISIEGLNPKELKKESEYMVVIVDPKKNILGYEKAELLQGYLSVNSSIINHYGVGCFISHFMELNRPGFIQSDKQEGFSDVSKTEFLKAVSLINRYLCVFSEEKSIINQILGGLNSWDNEWVNNFLPEDLKSGK